MKENTGSEGLKLKLPMIARNKDGGVDVFELSVDLANCEIVRQLEKNQPVNAALATFRKFLREAELDMEEKIVPLMLEARK